ncbi:MAG: hypothetical protein J6K41_03840 [Paraprevotella sp.]|nr:hypothetical protein [Paraprevotella sp.]
MLNKSKTLYKLFNIGTQIYSIDEFIVKFDEAINNNQKSASEYLDEIRTDYEKREIAKIETTSQYTLTHLYTSHKYFGYFNYMLERTSEDETVIILHKNNDVNQLVLIREIEIIVNRLAHAFNGMGAAFSLFDKDIELPQIREDKWSRILELNDVDMCLTKFSQVSMLCFWIKLKHQL